jgi:nitroimidazol reductase NimA-like FMN-containing flavoprotein (pyridoxamine 5'-phosphate oxidase superfamily)
MHDFDIDAFLNRPLTARLASVGRHGPAVRPIWYLWEHGSFWWLTGPWGALAAQLEEDPRVALVVDTCDTARGDVKQVRARGRAALRPYDAARAHRKLTRYLGNDPSTWDRSRSGRSSTNRVPRCGSSGPKRLRARDLSFDPSPAAPRSA